MNREAMAERDARIADEHASGATFAELAKRYGITRQRCQQIDEAVRRSRERSEDDLYTRVLVASRAVGTSHAARAYNAIWMHDMDKFVPTWDEVMSTVGVGIVTAAVIAVTLGIEIPNSAMDELMLRGYMKHWNLRIYLDTEDEM